MSNGHEIWHDPVEGTTIVNESDASTDLVLRGLAEQHPEIASMVRWQNATRRGGLFERDRFVTPDSVFDQMRVAQDAAESDDIVAGVIDSTESLAFNRLTIECDDDDEEDIWNQIAVDIDLDNRFREMWREIFTVSQVYVAAMWTTKSYKVRGRSKEGVKRKREFTGIRVPQALTILDPLKVVPVGQFMFGQERLAWAADRNEAQEFDRILNAGQSVEDEIVQRLIVGRYTATKTDEKRLGALGINFRDLFLLDPVNVWRHTLTRPQYKAFADVRMKSVFELLDLKHLLREMDRAHLLGGSNFIVLVKKGTEKQPAQPAEIAQLQGQVRALSRVPVIVGDNRLAVEIITPQTDQTLKPEKWNAIDARITARLYQMYMAGNYQAGAKGDDSMKLSRIVARGLESRRLLLRNAVHNNVFEQVFQRNPDLRERAYIKFVPKQIALDFDPGLATFFMDLRDRKEISRATILEQIDLDEDDEFRSREREEEVYDEQFGTLTPLTDPDHQNDLQKDMADHQQKIAEEQAQNNFDRQVEMQKIAPPAVTPSGGGKPSGGGAAKKDPKSAGRSGGGNRSGGGAAPGSGQGQAKDPRRRAGG